MVVKKSVRMSSEGDFMMVWPFVKFYRYRRGKKTGSSGFCAGGGRFEHPQLDFQGMAPASAIVVAVTCVYDSVTR